jgi:hypothetical protein
MPEVVELYRMSGEIDVLRDGADQPCRSTMPEATSSAGSLVQEYCERRCRVVSLRASSSFAANSVRAWDRLSIATHCMHRCGQSVSAEAPHPTVADDQHGHGSDKPPAHHDHASAIVIPRTSRRPPSGPIRPDAIATAECLRCTGIPPDSRHECSYKDIVEESKRCESEQRCDADEVAPLERDEGLVRRCGIYEFSPRSLGALLVAVPD